MRPLIICSGVFVLGLCNGAAHAEPPSAKVSTSYQSESGNAGLSSTSAAGVANRIYSVDTSSGTLSNSTEIRIGMDRLDPDYSRYLVTDKSGNITSLASTYIDPEYTFRAGADFFFKTLTVSVDGSETASDTPFPGYTGKITTSYEAYEYGQKYFLTISRADHNAPISYFVSPETFQTQLRPSRILEDRVSFAMEQLVSDEAKGKVEIITAERPQSRPPFIGGEATLGWANSNSSALIGKLGIARELRSFALYDDLGYFDASWAQIEYRLEPSYRWSISGILGTILETESARGILPVQRIGTDSIGIVTRAHGKLWDFGFKVLGMSSNIGYQSVQVGGDFTWQI